MKVVHCLNHFFPEHVAGTEVYVWALCKQLEVFGCESSVLLPHYNASEPLAYDYDGIPVFRYAEPSVSNREIITGKRLPAGLANFRTYLEEQQPDIIHFHEIAGSNGIGVAHFEVAKSTGAKVIFTIHLAGNTCRTGTLMFEGKKSCNGLIEPGRCGYCALVQKTGSRAKGLFLSALSSPFSSLGIDTLAWQNRFGTSLSYPFQVKRIRENLDRIAGVCDIIIPITQWYRRMLVENGVPEKKLKVVLQALPLNYNYILQPKQEISLPVKLLFVGRIDDLKGITLLIDVVKRFQKSELFLDIYGVAPDAAFLQQCKRATEDFTNIRWMGKMQQEEVIPVMHRYDALVLPSMFSEMSPLVIQEAFAAGLPVIGSNVYGIAEQVPDGVNGLLFRFGDRQSLQEVFYKVIHDPSQLHRMAGQLPQPRQFAEVAAETFQVYESLSNRKAVAAS